MTSINEPVGDAVVVSAPRAGWREVARRFIKNRLAVVGLVFLLTLVVLAVFAPFFAGYSYTATGTTFRAPPSRSHLFGTDIIGRDLFSRIVYGARVSLKIGFAASAIAVVIGVTVGSIAGFFGGIIDMLLMRIVDIFLAIPYIVLAVAIATVYGRSENSIIIVLGVTGWLGICRIVRASFLSLKQLEYVEAARALGYSKLRLIVRHMLPNALQPIIVYSTIGIGSVILSEAALSFLGVGPQEPTPAWGLMVAAGKAEISSAPHLLFFPGAAIALTVLSFVFIGDGLRDALDPKLK